MVEHNKIPVLEVEAVEFVAGALGVHDVFVDDEGGAFGVGRDALADLADGAEFTLRGVSRVVRGWGGVCGGLTKRSKRSSVETL